MSGDALIVATAARLNVPVDEVTELLHLYRYVLYWIRVPQSTVYVLLPSDVRWLVQQWERAT